MLEVKSSVDDHIRGFNILKYVIERETEEGKKLTITIASNFKVYLSLSESKEEIKMVHCNAPILEYPFVQVLKIADLKNIKLIAPIQMTGLLFSEMIEQGYIGKYKNELKELKLL